MFVTDFFSSSVTKGFFSSLQLIYPLKKVSILCEWCTFLGGGPNFASNMTESAQKMFAAFVCYLVTFAQLTQD